MRPVSRLHSPSIVSSWDSDTGSAVSWTGEGSGSATLTVANGRTDFDRRVDAAVSAHRSRYPDTPLPADLDAVRWLIEELRVSFFAQELGTAVSVSEKRVRQALNRAKGA